MFLVVLVLRWKAGSGFLRSWVCRGLEGFDVGVIIGEVLRGFKVFKIILGVCLMLFCCFSFCSLFRVEFIVVLIFCKRGKRGCEVNVGRSF